MLNALQMLVARGPGDAPERSFELVASMLVYIKEFSEHVHYPKEIELLFPTVLEVAPDTVRADYLGSRVHVRFEHPPEPIGVRMWQALRRLFLSQFHV